MANPPAPTKQRSISGVALVAALIVVAVWLGLLMWLIAHSDTTEIIWARWLTIMSALEAVAFAAAGAIFGTTVQHQRVAEAKARAETSDKRAEDAESQAKAKLQGAANGLALATAIKARTRSQKLPPAEGFAAANEGFAAPGITTANDPDLLAMAERLFPD